MLWFRKTGILLAFVASQAMAFEGTRVDGYVASVNDRYITVGDVMSLVQPTELQLEEMYQGAELDQKRKDVFNQGRDQLVERALILEDFKKQKAELPTQLVDQRINEIINNRFENNRAKLLEALADDQMTMEEWREEIQEDLTVGLVRRQEINDKVKVSPTQVWEAYLAKKDKYAVPEQIKLSMIVINQGTTAQEQEVKKQQAQATREKLLKGADFAETAKSVSEGSKASEGGEWGWVDPKILRAELNAALVTMKPGDLSEVIETDKEFYILKLEDHKDAGFTPYEDVRKDLEGELKQAEGERLYKAWIERLKQKNYVQIF